IHARLVRPLESGTKDERDLALGKVRKRHAVLAGVSKHADAAIGTAPSAAKDASALAQVLGSERGGSLVPGLNLQLLADESATRAGVLQAIAAVASRATPTDEVIF